MIDTVVKKIPPMRRLYRQSVILERDLGLEISRATLGRLGSSSRRVVDPYGRGDEGARVG